MAKKYIKNNYIKEFLSILRGINTFQRPSKTFEDWLIMVSASLYAWKKDMKIENEYLMIVKTYS